MTGASQVRQRILIAVGFGLSGLALYYFLGRVDGQQLLTALTSANLWILLFCVLTKGLVLALNATRTRILLLPLRRYRFVECFVPWLSGFVTDNLFPLRIGELVRIDLLSRAGRLPRSSTAAVVGVDRLLDLVSLLMLLVIAAPVLTIDLARANRLILVAGIVIACVSLVLWLATHPSVISRVVAALVQPMGRKAQIWFTEKAQQFSEGLGSLRSWKSVLGVLLITLLTRTVGMLTIQCWLWAFGLSLPLYAPLVVLLFISIGTMIPSSPGFVGTFHLAAAYALELMGAPPAVAASIAVAGHFMATVPWTAIGLFVCLPGIRRVRHQRRDSIRTTGFSQA